jgi:hypothetical protein
MLVFFKLQPNFVKCRDMYRIYCFLPWLARPLPYHAFPLGMCFVHIMQPRQSNKAYVCEQFEGVTLITTRLL